MATCYNCGKYIDGAGYKREVQTGSGVGFGMRRMNMSARIYFGYRTVCKDCAEDIDFKSSVARIILIVIGIAALIFMVGVIQNVNNKSEYNNNITQTLTKWFDKNNGESIIYSKPNKRSKVIGKIKNFNNFEKIGNTQYFEKYKFEDRTLKIVYGYIRKEDL